MWVKANKQLFYNWFLFFITFSCLKRLLFYKKNFSLSRFVEIAHIWNVVASFTEVKFKRYKIKIFYPSYVFNSNKIFLTSRKAFSSFIHSIDVGVDIITIFQLIFTFCIKKLHWLFLIIINFKQFLLDELILSTFPLFKSSCIYYFPNLKFEIRYFDTMSQDYYYIIFLWPCSMFYSYFITCFSILLVLNDHTWHILNLKRLKSDKSIFTDITVNKCQFCPI